VAEERRGRKGAGWSTAVQAVVNRLFVYGTLRSGQAARSLIANHVLAAEPASARGRMFALPDGYPGFLPGAEGRVVGEMMTLSDLAAAFALLDAYEGADFNRSLQEVELADGRRLWAWCYVLSSPALAEEGEPIPGGDWAAHLRGEG
jgi:gamma-glutamylcyclotransferase (GGCT)/AIG2-like uncharacterized protein YtfP